MVLAKGFEDKYTLHHFYRHPYSDIPSHAQLCTGNIKEFMTVEVTCHIDAKHQTHASGLAEPKWAAYELPVAQLAKPDCTGSGWKWLLLSRERVWCSACHAGSLSAACPRTWRLYIHVGQTPSQGSLMQTRSAGNRTWEAGPTIRSQFTI